MLTAAAAAASEPAPKPKPAPAVVPIVFDPILARPMPVSPAKYCDVAGPVCRAGAELPVHFRAARPLPRCAMRRDEVSMFPAARPMCHVVSISPCPCVQTCPTIGVSLRVQSYCCAVGTTACMTQSGRGQSGKDKRCLLTALPLYHLRFLYRRPSFLLYLWLRLPRHLSAPQSSLL